MWVRRIGVAVSDLLGITAQGLDTLHRQNKRHDFEHLRRVIRDYKIKEIVVGLPLRMSGAEGIQSDKMNLFAEDLRKRFKLPVHLWDERLTSAEANRLLRETDLSIEKRGKAVDRMAAILILQGWMEARAGSASRLLGFRNGIATASAFLGVDAYRRVARRWIKHPYGMRLGFRCVEPA